MTPIDPQQNFSATYARLPLLDAETYDSIQPDEGRLGRVLSREELNYYSTGLLWLRMLDIKAKQGRQSLTSGEKDIRYATMGMEYTANLCIPIPNR